jgi:hypothetical protein
VQLKSAKGAIKMPHVKTLLTIAVVVLVVLWATNRNILGIGSIVGQV